MKIRPTIKRIVVPVALFLLVLGLCACGKKEVIRNNANLSLDLGIGNTHFEDESDYPAPSPNAHLDVHASKIVICDAYESSIIETPFIYNTSSTAYPRMKLEVCSNKMFVVYCPDISVPTIQFASTDDGGATWSQSTLNLKTEMDIIDNYVATFWTPRNGALVAVDGTINTFVYITEDSGKTWQKLDAAPPEQDWHDLLEHATFLNREIGIISYDYHSKAANEPNIYLTSDGGVSWRPLYVVVPESVMDSYAKAGKPFYDGEKINIPINIYNAGDEITNTVYFVSFDLAQTWQFFVDDGGYAEQLRLTEMEKWVSENREPSLLFAEYKITKFAEFETVNYSDNVRIDVYSVDLAYDIKNNEWSRFKLTSEMHFDAEMLLHVDKTTGTPLLFFIYEGDVFNYTYQFLGSMGQKTYTKQSATKVIGEMIAERDAKAEISQLLTNALDAYSWFTPYVTVDIGNPEEYITLDNFIYFKAVLPEITTEELLKTHLEGIFTQQLVNSMMNMKGNNGELVFVEDNDILYRLSGFTSRYTNSDVQFSFEIKLASDKKATVTFKVTQDQEGNEVNVSYDCSVKKTDDGWRFESFRLPVDYMVNSSGGSGSVNSGTITDISQWDLLEYDGNLFARELVSAIIGGNYSSIADLLGGYAVEYVYLGPVNSGAYTITKLTENGVSVIELKVNDSASGKYYTRYIRQTESGSVTLSET